MTARGHGLWRDERGQVTGFVVILMIACLLCAGLVLDGGLVLAAKVRAVGQAEEAARAGAQELDLTAYRSNGFVRLQPAAATSAAQHFLASVAATGSVTTAGNRVTVQVSTHQTTQLLRLVGLTELSVTGQGQAEPTRGVTGEAP